MILNSRRLFQQFLVDGYTMVQSKRMPYKRREQKDLRSDTYSNLAKLAADLDFDVTIRGKKVILPSSYTGSPRYMMQNYLDAMTLCKNFGYPDLFITFTCNPNWPEIARFVAEKGLKFDDRPDVITRVFKQKLDSLMNKGPDRVTVAVENEEVDEISDYYDCRYLSACKAAWRIYDFDIHYRFPPVERLPFHLPNEQSVIFDEHGSLDYTLDKASVNETKFQAWMETNKTYTFAQKLLYVEFPKYYLWKHDEKVWQRRQKGESIGRIHHVPPSWGEMFYLRVFLNKVRGATDWEDFKKFDDVVYPTFKDACYARGLLEDDKEYIDGLLEASHWGM
ncbi:ATP-dependent DNA helicase PIF1-like protein [Tanacetum coccineum]